MEGESFFLKWRERMVKIVIQIKRDTNFRLTEKEEEGIQGLRKN